MEKEDKTHVSGETRKTTTEVFLQWGNKKRLRCVRVRGSTSDISDPSKNNNGNSDVDNSSRVRRKTLYSAKDPLFPYSSTRFPRNAETTSHRSENGKSTSTSPERHYTTRKSVVGCDEVGKSLVDAAAGNHHVGDANKNINNKINNHGNSGKRFDWPKIYITLSSKEKEEDFMAMKGCKLPQRPKKRAKVIQRTLLLVSPGAWLTDMSVERYEVREKKSSKKKARGLKAMGGMESDSE
ncbi:hypothetical protein Leryth_023574 [Lithospermum erythrorhizon]|uniref:Uncharacterized protein n=1 Tax=Lithospermum erythrorhizon TaxID=34254 RepID=A0AAV3RY58_LITER|nr:hypothetical protein Leryth_023574 [Lithospermum erythrorhizon]